MEEIKIPFFKLQLRLLTLHAIYHLRNQSLQSLALPLVTSSIRLEPFILN